MPEQYIRITLETKHKNVFFSILLVFEGYLLKARSNEENGGFGFGQPNMV